jgi:flagellin-like hook-associated protein FlgL
MAAEVTLTASMRANLYSLQQTASLMGTVQNRLSTGKKVNSALDNPNNYFTSQALTNRASDISALLDGMGQAIQAITTASQGITSAQSIVSQMKSVANSAASAITTASNASGTNVAANALQGTATANSTAIAAGTDEDNLLVDLFTVGGKNSLNIQNGDQMTVQVGSGTIYTFTVGASNSGNGVQGNGGGSTALDLYTWLDTNTGAAAVTWSSNGALKIATAAANLTISGSLATTLGLTATGTSATKGGTVAIGVAALGGLSAAKTTTLLANVTNSTGKVLVGSSGTGSQGAGNYLTLSVAGGENKTINITDKTTVQDVLDNINSMTGLSATLDGTGALKITNNNATTLTIGGSADGILGGAAATTIASNASQSTTIYAGYGAVSASTLPSTSLQNLQPPSGLSRIATGDQLTVTVGTTTTTISVTAATNSATQAFTVQGLMNALGQISGITANLNTTTGQLDISSTNGQKITFGGNAAAKLSLPSSVAPGQSSLAGAGVNPTLVSQFDELRSQLDQMVGDASYQGINLISSTNNNPLTVTFNEAASNPNKLVVNAVDLTTTGLDISKAFGAWKDADTIQASISELTSAATSLRNAASTFGQNLTTVQTRQDFATNMIQTLKAGADKLTMADMNEEGANMLALQTRSQLGIQSLSLASQANQAVMRLFG